MKTEKIIKNKPRCKLCGKEVSANSIRCKSCSNKQRVQRTGFVISNRINDKDFLHNEYIISEKAMSLIAKENNVSLSTVRNRLINLNIPIRSISIGKLNEKNPMWKGDWAGYETLHGWVKRRKLKPLYCENCKIKTPQDLANISGEYKRDINDYKWLCRSCHMKFDYQNGVRTQQKNVKPMSSMSSTL